jgi:hypothetical protein
VGIYVTEMFRLHRNVFEKLVHFVNNPLILNSDVRFFSLLSFSGVVTAKDISG